MQNLKAIIDPAFENRAQLKPNTAPAELHDAVNTVLRMLENGEARIAEKKDGEWVVNEWLKKAVLLFFRLHDNQVHDDGLTRYFDKVPLKYADYDAAAFQKDGVRVVPPAVVRRG
ncbi:MAG TPA: 2,3,4,5-tetrahydropyridine-2,6-dicarboxylate N-succinyltransferase, partial [Gammaproteobacteria bacterium]|nr:2,3,4,5-tetrahydropyridine-2,6-dicarboxylate N-succinyltransferase [Gammaproteobacteria bacterium]